jgi:hypothetical protein
MEYALYIKKVNIIVIVKHCKEVPKMNADLDTISEIVARYGFSEWSLVGFTRQEITVYFVFYDPSILPVFKIILISMKTVVNMLKV